MVNIYNIGLGIVFLVIIMLIVPSEAKEVIVEIPYGVSNPSFDPQIEGRAENWFIPPEVKIMAFDTVTWVNNDITRHDISSGIGVSRFEGIQGVKGEPDGKFASQIIEKNAKWSYTFTEPGVYPYFCAIHPWMVGAVIVEVPDYAHDADGNVIEFPIIARTPDGLYTPELRWDPPIIKSGEPIVFTNAFYDINNIRRVEYLKYEFVLILNNEEIYRVQSHSGGGAENFKLVINEPGMLIIRYENVGGIEGNDVEFTTRVYGEPNLDVPERVETLVGASKGDPELIFTLVNIGYITLGGSIAALVIYYKMYWKKSSKNQS
jgi:plastocyanin